MAVQAVLNAFLYCDEWDATGDSRELALSADSTALDATTFRAAVAADNGWEITQGGAKKFTGSFNGFWRAATTPAPDAELFTNLGVTGRVLTQGMRESEGTVAYLSRIAQISYREFGAYNTLAPFSLNVVGSHNPGLVRGALAKAAGAVSATGALGTGIQLGAVGASQFLYATFHLLVAATTITVVVESDDNSGFTTPTTRATIGPLTVAGGTWITPVAGAITDDWWRMRVTAITGTHTVAGAIGIQ